MIDLQILNMHFDKEIEVGIRVTGKACEEVGNYPVTRKTKLVLLLGQDETMSQWFLMPLMGQMQEYVTLLRQR